MSVRSRPAGGIRGTISTSHRDGTMLSLAVAMEVSSVTTWAQLDQGWVPLDEGTIAGAAERVLRGALPHVDFTYPYTGALPFYHALAMRLFGVTLMASRYALFAAFLLWLPAVWWLARRACGNHWAALITIVAAWWSVTVYSAAMPSWYLLFFATWIVVAIERWHTTGRGRWLAVAGVAAGTAIIIKQTGLYLLAGALLGMLFCEQEQWSSGRERTTVNASERRTNPYVIAALAGVAVAVGVLLRGRAGRSGELLELVLPIGAMLLLAASREVRLTVPGTHRLRRLLQLTALIGVAAAVPIALLVLRYVNAGAGHALIAGAVHEGFARVPLLQSALPSAWTILLYASPVFAVLALEYHAGQRWWAPVIGGIAAVGLVALTFASRSAYLALWYFGMSLLPAAIILAAVTARRGWRRQIPLDPVVLAVAAMTAMFSLNQFPYSAPNYFAYVAPLAILTAALVAAYYRVLPKLVFGGTALAVFAGIALRVGSVHTVGLAETWWDDNHRLAVARGGLRIPAADSAQYTDILRLVAEHRGTGTLYAGPELPEMYFLAGTHSPLREVYRFLPAGTTDSTQMDPSFDVRAAKIVLINHAPIFLDPIPPSVLAWLAIRYPESTRIGTIEARWR